MSTVDAQLAIGPELNGALMTPEEFDAADDWDEEYRYELINGVLIVSPPPLEGERGPNQLLGYLLLKYQEEHPQGAALDCTLEEHMITTNENRRRADRVIWAGLGKMPNVRRERPTIAVEFVSEGRRNRQRDYETKRDEYLEMGIAEYWVFDRFRRTLTVFRRRGKGVAKSVVRENETYTTKLLPGFELPLKRLFGFVDQLEQAMQDDA